MEETLPERLILVVQENPEHRDVLEQVFAESAMPHRTITLPNGKQALDFLYRRGDYSEAPRPDLILLELNLPEKDGREILAEIKKNPQLRRIPIIILTVSDSKEDIFRAYALQGNCYVIKSSDLEQLALTARRIEEFWLGIVTLPLE
ncbi:MAG: response regulator [Leptolyngbyaceae cyanobacterium bins.59]|nr:response regulator [Leptolyngbyaceae cyanobacterium bins.59]